MKTLQKHRSVRPVRMANRRCRPLKHNAPVQKDMPPAFRLKKILVPTDFSECSSKALDYAVAFAARMNAEIVLLHAVEPMIYPTLGQEIPSVLSDYQQDTVEVSRKQLAHATRKHIRGKVPSSVLAVMGHAAVVIVDSAKLLGADLIIIGTHGYTGLKHVLLGSTAERVVRLAPCPVLTVRGEEHEIV